MTHERFVYWLQGFCELTTEPPTPDQWQSIKEHLSLVFDKRTPPMKLPDLPIAPRLPDPPDLPRFDPPTFNPPPVGDFPTGPIPIC